jgi:hypothetical protein
MARLAFCSNRYDRPWTIAGTGGEAGGEFVIEFTDDDRRTNSPGTSSAAGSFANGRLAARRATPPFLVDAP